MSFEVRVQASFSAAHQLRGYKGKCENMHGHNWKVEVACRTQMLDKQGMVCDFTYLKAALNRVLETLDHKVLNDAAYFKKVNPTSENIAKYVFEALEKKLSALKCRISAVSVWETDISRASYRVDK